MMKLSRNKISQFILLALGVALLPSCSTVNDSRPNSANSLFVYSRMANRPPATSPVRIYCHDYWRAVCDEQGRMDLQYKQTQQFSWLHDSSRDGFRCGTVEVDYEVSRKGVMTIRSVRRSPGLIQAQVTYGTRAMTQAAGSLKPFSTEVASVAGEAILDTMVFEFR